MTRKATKRWSAELYWSVQRRVAKRNRRRLVQIIPGMLAKLRQGLQVIEFPPEHITDFFTQLIGMHEAALEGGRSKARCFAPGQWCRCELGADHRVPMRRLCPTAPS